MATITETPTAITADNVIRLFPFVDTHHTSTATATDPELQGYDETQVRLMKEECIVLDEDDIAIGSASKKDCQLAFIPS